MQYLSTLANKFKIKSWVVLALIQQHPQIVSLLTFIFLVMKNIFREVICWKHIKTYSCHLSIIYFTSCVIWVNYRRVCTTSQTWILLVHETFRHHQNKTDFQRRRWTHAEEDEELSIGCPMPSLCDRRRPNGLQRSSMLLGRIW
jgi:hypothetical protein